MEYDRDTIHQRVESPTDHSFLCMIFDDAVRLCEKKSKTPKDPISHEIMKSIFEYFESESLQDLRFLVMCNLGFLGFFQINELLTVRLKITSKSLQLT